MLCQAGATTIAIMSERERGERGEREREGEIERVRESAIEMEMGRRERDGESAMDERGSGKDRERE